jgi:ankyrin repeat protein
MRRLLSCGFQLNVFDDLSYAPLHYAVRDEHYKAAEWLLDQGADVNAHGQELLGETPLSLASQGDYPEIAELLLKRGADPDVPGWMALTARLRALRRKDEEGQKIAALIHEYRPR